jgi:hypothetical protein
MLQWFRACSRSIAVTALLSLVALTAWSAGPHQDDCHDVICATTVPHDASAHSVSRSTSSTDRPLHCVLCHWTRIIRPSANVAHHLAPAVEHKARSLVNVISAPQTILAAQPPLRAPPSSPALDA